MRTRSLPNGRSVNVRDNGGLKKRCGCPRRQWSKSGLWLRRNPRFPLDFRLPQKCVSRGVKQPSVPLAAGSG